jgi:structural maintenance of chromosome 1
MEADLNAIMDRKNATDELVEQTFREIEAKRKELNALTSERLRVAQMRTELEEKLQEVLRKLLDADDGRKETEREVKIREMVSSLKRIFPGVKGRVSDLCKPKQKKYAEAVSIVLGRNFDAVVVDTEKTATACIQHLKDQRSGTGIFRC